MGEPEAVKKAVIESIGIATELIDMNVHKGEHREWEQLMLYLSYL